MHFFWRKFKGEFDIISPVKISDTFKLFLASGFFLGLSPIVPGSFGALSGLAWHYTAWHFQWDPMHIRIWCLTGAVFFSAIHYLLTPWAQKHWGEPDPKHFVLDDIVGYLCVPVFCPFAMTELWHLLAAFVIFRIFDAIKLPGARYIDRNIHTASGVLFDDVVSAAWTALALWGAAALV